ncbi:MAG: DNA helicase UvrBC [Planctomycetaceae bacterium]|nr:DNA helicase UvrBC [Planctomycetaceae bacterium]
MARGKHIDHILREWAYDPATVKVRLCQGADGRDVLQMRLDMGILQLETHGRPDGSQPHGYETYLDYLISRTASAGDAFRLDEEQCGEVDREFVQFYHRRVCWLKLQSFRSVVDDADHTLALMDFCRRHSPGEQWTAAHERHRPLVLFHRTQASALAELEQQGPVAAVHEVNRGLQQMQQLFREQEQDTCFEDDVLVQRLSQLRESLRQEYGVGRTLQEQLADAVAAEEYELAARLRDRLARRQRRS